MNSMAFDDRMTSSEKRISGVLAAAYALRLFGIFLLLPVFTIYASTLPGGDDPAMVGLAFGIYGLTQAVLQLPLGFASDRFGRKKILYAGLLVFAAGSFLSAAAPSVHWLIAARALQGAGAVSAVITALLADLTRDEVRTRAMAMIGMSIGLTFSVSLILAPLLNTLMGVTGIFILTGLLVLAAMGMIHLTVKEPQKIKWHEDAQASIALLPKVFKDPQLWRINFGIFALHCAQMAMFVALPIFLEFLPTFAGGAHWKLYLPVTLIGMVLMVPAIIIGETRGHLKTMLIVAILLLATAQLLLGLSQVHFWGLCIAMTLYFIGLNIAEAILPSWVSKASPTALKGTAMGVYNTAMSLGLFSGSLSGGLLIKYAGALSVFYFATMLMLIWLGIALFAAAPKSVRSLIFPLPKSWQNHSDTLNLRLCHMNGIIEVAFSQDKQTLYLKAERSLDTTAIQTLLSEYPDD